MTLKHFVYHCYYFLYAWGFKIKGYFLDFFLNLNFVDFNSSQNTISSNHSDLPASRLTGATPSGWVESINSPLIQEDGDNKMLKLRFDVSQYEPEEIVVKTVDNKLLVCVNNIVHVTFLPVFVGSAAQSKIICAVT